MAVPYLYTRVDEEIRLQVEAKLANHYEDLTVSVRFAKLIEGQGIEIRGVSISEPGVTGPQAELAYIDEIFLKCGTELKQLVSGMPDIQHITVRRPRIRMSRRPDGSWSAQSLWPPPKLSEHPANITIENGAVEIADATKDPASLLTLRELNFTVEHEMVPADASHTESANADHNGADGAPPPPTHVMHIAGTLSGDHLRRIDVAGRLMPASAAWSFDGKVESLEFSPEFLASLPSDFSQPLAAVANLRAQADVEFHLDRHAEPSEPLVFQVNSRLSRGRIDDPRLPYPLNDLRGTLRCNNAGITIEDLVARNGQTTLRLGARRVGYGQNAPLTLSVDSRRMALDGRLFETLPDNLKSVWHKFFPLGEIDLTATVAFDGTTWKPDLTAHCLNVSFLPYVKFPYRLERGAGKLTLKNDLLTVDLTAYSGPDEVRIHGAIQHPGPDFTGEIKAEAPLVRLDDKLFAALQEPSRGVIRSLNPAGTFNCFVHLWRGTAKEELHKYIGMRLNHCSLRYEKFPYPLTNITGTIEMHDGDWTFKELEGVNDTGRVKCQGRFGPLAKGSELLLNFTATDLPLEEELRESLNPRARGLWNMLRPRGVVDVTSSEVRYLSREASLSVAFRLETRGDVTSIEPTCFPYRLEKLNGAVAFQEGYIQIERLRAVHDRTQIVTSGDVHATPEGNWQLSLKELTVDRLHADRDLLAALPGRLKRLVTDLDPSGPVNLRGAVNLFGASQPDLPIEASWDVALEFNHTSLDAGIKLDDLVGGVRLLGRFDGQQAQAWGDLNLDSVIYKDLQFTEVLGPLWIDDGRVILGTGAQPAAPGRPQRRIMAKLYGGRLMADARITLGPAPQFSLRANLVDADMARFMQETVAGRQKLSGKVAADLELAGKGRGTHTLQGNGSIRLREADIYELPVMVSLLKILSVRPPDTTAFTESDMEFVIRGNHIYFNKMNFNGDAVSLRGTGEMSFDKDIQLKLYAAVGRRELKIPVISAMVKGASQQFMEIRVEGTVDSPVATAEAFPGVNQAFKDLEAGLNGNPQAPGGRGP